MKRFFGALAVTLGLVAGTFGVAYATTLIVTQGGTGVTALPTNALLIGNNKSAVKSTSSPTVGFITATNTNATSSLPNANISGTLQIGAEFIKNFTTYVRALFTAGTGINISGGAISFSAPANSALPINYASTTAITSTVASTTKFFAQGIGCPTGNYLTWTGGLFGCSQDITGSSQNPWATTTSQSSGIAIIYPSTNNSVVAIGSNATTTSTFYFDPNTGTASIGSTTNGNNTTIQGNGATSSFGGPVTVQGWAVSTSTTICPDGTPSGQCQYVGGPGLQQAITDGWNTIYLKNGDFTITSPIYIPRAGFSIIGASKETSVIRYNGNSVKIGIMMNNPVPGAEYANTFFSNFQIKEDSTGGLSTCFDSSHLVSGTIRMIKCNDQKFGFMASTGNSYYMTYDTDEMDHLIGHIGNDPMLAVGFYLGDPVPGSDSGPINNTLINPLVDNFINASSTAYYFNSHSITCFHCDSEGGYVGMHLGPRASDFTGNVYLEANTIGLTMEASAAQVGSVNITGNISDSVPITNNIVDNGAVGLCVNARIQYAAQNYCTNVKQGFGTNNPKSVLEVSNETETSTPGLSSNTLGLYGGRGTGIGIDFKSGASWSGREIVNPSVSTNFPLMDFVVSTSSVFNGQLADPLGVRFVQANSIGTGDMFIQVETATSGYAVYEGLASSTLGSTNKGTMISSSNGSPVILAPNRTERLRADPTTGFIGIGTTSPGTLLSIGNVSAINLSNGTSTWNTAGGININTGCFALKGICLGSSNGTVTSVATDGTLTGGPISTTGTLGINLANANNWTGLQTFTKASSTQFTTTNNTYLSTTGGFTVVGTTTNIDPITSAGRGKFLVQEPSDDINNGITVLNNEGVSSMRMWEDAAGAGRIDSGSNGQGNLVLNGIGSGPVGIATSSPFARLSIGTIGGAGVFTNILAVSTSSQSATTTDLLVDYLGNWYFQGGSGIALGTSNTPPGNGILLNGLLQGTNGYFSASSTIGDGTLQGGLSVSGGASTTNNLYVGTKIGINTSTPAYSIDIFDPSVASFVSVHGGGSGATNGGIKLDENAGARGGGIYTFSPTQSREWFFGNPYINGASAGPDNFAINRKSSASTFNLNAADVANSTNLLMLSSTGNLGLSTTTPTYVFNPFSATAPQVVLSAGAGLSQWAFRNEGGWLAIATTSVAGTATSTVDSIKIDPNGAVYLPSSGTSGANQTGYWCYDTNGQLIRDTTVCLVSALKFKKDIEPLTMGLETVMKMKPVTYYLKQPLGKNDAGQQIGFVADWSESIVPQLVTHDSNGDVHGFSYEQFTAVLTKAIQEMFTWNTKQDDRIQKLEDRVAALEAENAAFKHEK